MEAETTTETTKDYGLELTNNSTSRITRCDLKRQTYLDYGGKSRQGPTLISDGFRCDGLDVGQRRRGDLVFRRGRYDLPFGLYLQSPAKKSVFIHLYDDKFDVLVDKLNAPLLDDREKNDKRDIN